MIQQQQILNLLRQGEGTHLEFKRAAGGLPRNALNTIATPKSSANVPLNVENFPVNRALRQRLIIILIDIKQEEPRIATEWAHNSVFLTEQ